jgi:CheY-like chemotaxis protein
MPEREDCVLVVDDEVLIALSLSEMLEDMGLPVCGMAATAKRAIELTDAHRPTLVLMDVRLKGTEDDVHAALEIHRRHGTPIIFITGSREQSTIDRINQDHPAGLLIKPILPEHLKGCGRTSAGLRSSVAWSAARGTVNSLKSIQLRHDAPISEIRVAAASGSMPVRAFRLSRIPLSETRIVVA